MLTHGFKVKGNSLGDSTCTSVVNRAHIHLAISSHLGAPHLVSIDSRIAGSAWWVEVALGIKLRDSNLLPATGSFPRAAWSTPVFEGGSIGKMEGSGSLGYSCWGCYFFHLFALKR